MDSLISAVRVFLAAAIILVFALNVGASENLLEKGITEYKSENYEESLAILTKAKQEQPDSSRLDYYLGLAYKQTGNFGKAAESFKDAVKLSPVVPEAYAELIRVLYDMNDLNEARGWIARAQVKGIKLPRIIFLKGLILSKEEKYGEAVKAFEEAKGMDKSLRQASDFQIAMIYARERKVTEAEKSLRAVIAADPSSEVAAFAREYEKSIKGLEGYRQWRLQAGVAYEYDDNVVLKPSEAIPGVLITGEKDSGIVGTFRVDYASLPSGSWFFNGQFNVYSDTYFHTSSYNMVAPTVTLSPGYNFTTGAVTFPLVYSYVWLGGKGYEDIFSARPTYTKVLSPGNVGQLSAGYARRDIIEQALDPDENRDGNIYSVLAGYIHTFSGGKGVASIKYEFSRDVTSGQNWTNTGHRIDASVLAPLSDKVKVVASGEAFLQNYRFNSIFEVSRRDRTYSGSANIIWQFSRFFDLNLQYTHTTADSNIPLYDYSRNIYMAGIECRY